MIEINIQKLERGAKKEWKTVTRDGKTFKQRFATGKKKTGGVISFDSYADAMEYADKRSKDYSSKNEFYASDEYKTLLPVLKEMYKIEVGEWAKSADKAMKSAGVKPGDKVRYTNIGSFMSAEDYSGVIVLRKGIPYVKLDPGQLTIDNKKSVRWHKGWKI